MRRLVNGDCVVARRDFDYAPYTRVHEGELGTVVARHGDCVVEVKLKERHPGLVQWDNTLIVFHEDYDDWLRRSRVPMTWWQRANLFVPMAVGVFVMLGLYEAAELAIDYISYIF